MTVAEYRDREGLTLEAFAALFGKSKGYFSEIEKTNRCPPKLALDIERETRGLVDAASLNDTIREARKAAA